MAKDLFFTARRINAKEAREIGLITRVSEPEELMTLQGEYKQALVDNAPITVRAGKAIIAEILKASPEVDHDQCRQLIHDCFDSEDYSEGRRAFMEKRKPVFRGK
jgi:enoyl-CoA hydratase/carnithine racemase